MSSAQELLSRFGRGRVALLAVKQALASSSSRGSCGAPADCAEDEDDHYGSEAASVARSGSSFSHRSPVAVPQQLEFEYSQASQPSHPSLLYGEDDGEDGESEAEGATGHQMAAAEASCSEAGGAGTSMQSSPSTTQALPERCEQEGPSSPDEALLLSSALNDASAGMEGLGHGALRSPPLARLRREMQRELSGAGLLSPLAAVVSEHSFEDAAMAATGLAPFGSGSSLPVIDELSSPTAAPGPAEAAAAAPARHAPLDADSPALPVAEQPDREEPPCPDRQLSSMQPGVSRKAPLHRAATPLALALEGKGRPGSARRAAGDKGAGEHWMGEDAGCSQESKMGKVDRPLACAIKQQVWSFDAVPQGRATIPSSHLPPERPSPGVKPRPSTRAVAQRPRSAQKVKPEVAEHQESTGASSSSSPVQGQSGLTGRGGAPQSRVIAAQGRTVQQQGPARLGPSLPLAHVDRGKPSAQQGVLQAACISAEELQAVGELSRRAQPATATAAAPEAATASVPRETTPQQTDAVHTGPGRFQQQLECLQQLMSQRMQRRQQAQDELIQQVSRFEESVRAQQLGRAPAHYAPDATDAAALQQWRQREVPLAGNGMALQPEKWGSEAPRRARLAERVGHAKALSAANASAMACSSPPVAAASVMQFAGTAGQDSTADEGQEEDQATGSSSATPKRRALLAKKQHGRTQATAGPTEEPGPAPAETKMVTQEARQSATAVPAGERCGPCTMDADNAAPKQPPDTPGMEAQAQPSQQSDSGSHSSAPTLPASAGSAAAPEGYGEQQAHSQALAAGGGKPSSPPGQLKPIMQVKGEQDLAIKYLAARQRPFRASPIPLSSVEPRLAEMAQHAQQRRAQAREERLEMLRSQERPFSFHERNKARQLAAASRTGSSGGGGQPRPRTPPTFLANPVPVSTSEARYAVLVAEMQLLDRSIKGHSLEPSPVTRAASLLRPATAGAALARQPALDAPPEAPPRPVTAQHARRSSSTAGGSQEASGAACPSESAATLLLFQGISQAFSSSADYQLCPGHSYSTSTFGSFKGAVGAILPAASLRPAIRTSPLWKEEEVRSGTSVQECTNAAMGAAMGAGSGGGSQEVAGNSGAALAGSGCWKINAAAEQQHSTDGQQQGESSMSAEAGSQAAGSSCMVAAEGSMGLSGAAGEPQGSSASSDDCALSDEAGREIAGEAQEQLQGAGGTAAAIRGLALEVGTEEQGRSDAGAPGQPPQPPGIRTSRPAALGKACACSPWAVGTTRSQQLKAQAVREGLASGRYSTELERRSASALDLKDIGLLCSSPKHRAAAGVTTAGSSSQAAAWAGDMAPGGAAGRRPAAAPDCDSSQVSGSLTTAHVPPGVSISSNSARAEAGSGQAGALGVDLSSVQPGACSAGPEGDAWPEPPSGPLQSEESEYGLAVPKGPEADQEAAALDSPDSHRTWRLGTEVTLPAAVLSPGGSRGALSAGEVLQGPARGGVAPARGFVQEGSSVWSAAEGEKRRDTPQPHIEARHRQAEAAAKAEVRRLLLKRGMTVYNYVEGGQE